MLVIKENRTALLVLVGYIITVIVGITCYDLFAGACTYWV